MKTILLDCRDRVLLWVGEKVDAGSFADDAQAIGWEKNGELVAGVVFEKWDGPNIFMHVAVTEGMVVTKRDLRIVFSYPFTHLKCNRVTGLVRVDNIKAQRFDEHLGFVREGQLRQAHSDGTDMYVYGMTSKECRWIGVNK